MSIFPNNDNNRSPIGNPFNDRPVIVSGMPIAVPSIDISSVMRFVYLWMGVGLAVTAIVAAFINGNTSIMRAIYGNPSVIWGVIIAQLGVVLVLNFAQSRLSPAVAGILFLVYAAITGVSMAVIVSLYTSSSVAMAFGTTAVLFGVMTVFAFTTKMDLSKFGTFFLMALIGLIVTTLLNVFIFKSAGLDLALSYFGVILFTGLTAYDTYQIKKMAESPQFALQGSDAILKLSIMGALRLYLDFINLFLYILRAFGSRRN